MSAPLIVLIPLVLLGLAAALCFVGCQDAVPFIPGPYETAIEKTPGVVAYWPLNDEQLGQSLPIIAADVAPKPPSESPFNGEYKGTLNTSFKIGQPSIVPGDTSNFPTCASFNGVDGFISVPFHQELNPGSFTLEAWVQPSWSATDPQVARAVLSSFNLSAGAGYALFATPDNFWEIQIGTGAGTFFSVTATQPIEINADPSQNPVNYLAATFDATTQTLSLFVGAVSNGIPTPLAAFPQPVPAGSMFQAEQSQQQPSTATPLFIGMGRPDTMNGLFPFEGFIQDVAVYNTPLGMGDLGTHYSIGATAPTDGT